MRFLMRNYFFADLRQRLSPWRRSSQCLHLIQSYRAYSNPPGNSLVKVRSIPAPHTGVITILTLASPTNRNAISRQLLNELLNEINAIYNQWGFISGPKSARFKPSQKPPAENIPTDALVHADSALGSDLVPRDIATSTRVLILKSEVDTVFCAGADLKERSRMSHEETNQFLQTLRATFGKLATLPIPTISAVSGFALGGGLELALATTFRVLSTAATVGLPETRLGIIPGAGGIMRLSRLVGRVKAADMILTGRRISGREAFSLGICERLVEEREDRTEELDHSDQKVDLTLGAAMKMAEEICEGGPAAIGAALRAVDRGQETNQSQWEDAMYERVLETGDRDEALLAFREKRKPNFKGH